MLLARHAAALCVGLAAAPALAAEPWSDDDPSEPPARHEFDAYGFSAGAEYRANGLYVNRVALSGEHDRHTSFIEHRLRLDAALDYEETVAVVLSLDALDGSVWEKENSRAEVGYQGGDPFDPDSYGYVFAPNAWLKLRRAYGEVTTPVGLLRFGRQPTLDGMGVLAADGDGRPNRFGYANAGDSSDRVLFVTKPLEALKPADQRDPSRDRGVFVAAAYDRVAGGALRTFGEEAHGVAGLVRWSHPDPALRQTLDVRALYAYRWDRRFDTDVHVLGLRAMNTGYRFSSGFEVVRALGNTREVSDALARVRPGTPVSEQRIAQWGARGVARWDDVVWTAYLEVDYASGDSAPYPESALSQFYWAPDTNVGLLMFERVLAFESARSAGSSTALLQSLGAPEGPGERVDTQGSFTNAVALFPQFDLRAIDNLLFRVGVLVAWAATGVVDPITSLSDGVNVNYHGGKPGSFYGTELDARFQWRYAEHFLFDLEAAVLFPGDAFHDARGHAATSSLVQGRATFAF